VSQAPVQASEYQGMARDYAEATVELNRQVDAGTSWSGNERNNLFLNLGKEGTVPSFTDASALLGFDFPDDSRGLASLDWDFDGDLDFITTNRTAPRVRIFENRVTARHADFVSVKLVGESINRDAIGSRVELTLATADGNRVVLVRSLHAGQGFISQSSKLLHFGIPQGAKIVRLLVKWPGSQAEEFSGITAGKFVMLRQGTGKSLVWAALKLPIAELKVISAATESTTEAAHLERPIPMPAVPYSDLDGLVHEVGAKLERPLVLNLWATWCVPCLAELKGMAREAELFRSAGVDVLALCVDVATDDPSAIAKAKSILSDTGYPFSAGIPHGRTVELLHLAHNVAFVRPDKLPVPTTFLIDTSGCIASVFRGAIEPAALFPAIAALKGSSKQWAAFSNPFEGTWHHGADTIFYVGIAKEMLDRGWVDEAERFVIDHRQSLLLEGQKYAELLMVLGTQFVEREEYVRGIRLLEIAVEVAPELAVARNNLAVAMLQSGQASAAVPHLETAIKLDQEFLDPVVNLARIRFAQKRLSDAKTLLEGIPLKTYHPGAVRLMAQLQLAENDAAAVLVTFSRIVEHEPNDPIAWLNLGKLQAQLGITVNAIASLERAQFLDPDSAEIRTWIDRLLDRSSQ
jgi:Flp pilus assembly protein TadD/thiol-disulfide isomerase/thioredoxin